MKMHGYVKKGGGVLYARKDGRAKEFWLRLIKKYFENTDEEAEEYLTKHFNEVEIEYNEVT